ncbi:interleukin-1 receptor-like 1 isoform X2 [Kryptolebias marmoratus]|uniref:interleukin-1 receptor-like 1 isoform X2 n=1 Tax=Kryptolebias marmoratus TaxID=37003 RepID=UPI000D5308D3|nr:interleukin-1 receptor-like 1 isoform X2 [Kryptolebias marmoratus]
MRKRSSSPRERQSARLKMVLPLLLFLLLTFITGVRPQTRVNVKAGDLVLLQCGLCPHDVPVTLWRTDGNPKTVLSSNMSAAEQEQRGVIVFRNTLVVLSASVDRQGNYSCSYLRNTSIQSQFLLRVYSAQSKDCEKKYTYNMTCYTQTACRLFCPEVNIPTVNISSLIRGDVLWHQNGKPTEPYFQSVEKTDSGMYTCTWPFLHSGRIYNRSFTVVLDVQTDKPMKNYGISSPQDGQVFQVELDTTVVITCRAVTDSCFSSLFWLSDDQFVSDNETLRVYNNRTCNETNMARTASLVFRKVQEEDLSKNFTCKFESDELGAITTITLMKTARPSYVTVAVCSVVIVVVMAASVVIYVKFKVDVTLFFRDSLGCQSGASDEKVYDAFVMCYKSDSDGGLNEDDRRCLEKTLEERFGYKLCLFDRDVLPGQEQSRAVVLVPCYPDPGPGTGLLSAIHAALVERQTRLIFIDTEQAEGSRSGSLPEALQLLSEAGDCVTWRGSRPSSSSSSSSFSSSFWKQLRYHLPAPRRESKQTHQLLPQTCKDAPLL